MNCFLHVVVYSAIFFYQTCAETHSKVIIVGSGIAGLAAADQLITTHRVQDVLILEALDRVGGRVDELNIGDAVIEKGAEVIHGTDNPIYQLAQRLNLLASSKMKEKESNVDFRMYTQDGQKMSKDDTDAFVKWSKLVDKTVNEIGSNNSTVSSAGQVFEAAFTKLVNDTTVPIDMRKGFEQIKRRLIENEDSANDWSNLSVRGLSGDDVVFNKPAQLLGPKGFKPMLDYFVDRISTNKIHLNKTVKQICYQPDNVVQIFTKDGQRYTADHVIVTASLGVLKQCHRKMFMPNLPKEKVDIIERLGFDSVDKLYFVYDRPFWDSSDKSVSMNLMRLADAKQNGTENEVERSFWFLMSMPYHDNILLSWVTNKDAPATEKATDQQLIKSITNVLRRFLNDSSIEQPVKVMRTNWRIQPTILGSYSYYSMQCEQFGCSREIFSEPIYTRRQNKQIPTLLFAGEATHKYFTADGAYLSGIREADKLKTFLNQ